MKKLIIILSIFALFFACDGDNPTPKPCECVDKQHWSDDPCACDGEPCNCTTVQVANGAHITGTERYDDDLDDCYVIFNGEKKLKKGDNCEPIGPRPVPCPCPEGTTHEEGEECCDGDDCTCQVAVHPVCECGEDKEHWEGEECCTNNGGEMGEGCGCIRIPFAVASGEHITGTERYDDDLDDCYVIFNGEKKLKKGDMCVKLGERPEEARMQDPVVLENPFGEDGFSTTVSAGTEFTDTEWFKYAKDEDGNDISVAELIAAKLESGFTTSNAIAKNRFRSVFGPVIQTHIEVVKPSEEDGWKKYKVDVRNADNNGMIYLNFNTLDDELQATLIAAITAIASSNIPSQVKAQGLDAIKLANAPFDVKLFTVYAWCQAPKFSSVVRRHDAPYLA